MFQTLPHLIIDNIVQYLITFNASSSLCDLDSYDYQENKEHLYLLLNTCQVWRETAKRYLCKSFAIRFNHWVGEPSYIDPPFPYEPYVKTLRVLIEYTKIACGEFSQYPIVHQNNDMPYMFPNVQRQDIIISFNTRNHEEYNLANKIWGNQAYIHYLQRLAPSFSEVHITFWDWMPKGDNDSEWFPYISEMTGQLSQLTNKTKFTIDIDSTCSNNSFKFQPKDIKVLAQNLTNIEVCSSTEFDIMYLVTECSCSLHTLTIFLKKDRYYQDIIGVGGNEYAIYPNLRNLTIRNTGSARTDSKASFPQDIVPFPNLQILRLEGKLPLGDDVLFRGNNFTLQYVRFEMVSELLDSLFNNRIFYPGSHKNLKFARIYKQKGSDSKYREKKFSKKCEKLLADIASNAKFFETDFE